MFTSYILSPLKVLMVAQPYMWKNHLTTRPCLIKMHWRMNLRLSGLKLIQDQSATTLLFVYRHPDTDAGKFIFEHTLLLIKITTCILGHFNINFLNYETHSDTNNFLNSTISHYLLTHVLQPTRVTDYSATVIDNIFTNATDFETVSGNILNQIADPFSQFLILRKLSVTHKDIAFYQYDYSNFDKDKFTADFPR